MRIAAHGLGASFNDRTVLDDVTFTAEPGSITAIVGSNGSGKSTLFRRMIGLVRGPGSTLFDGHRYPALPDPTSHVGVSLGTTGFYPRLTVEQHLRAARADRAALPHIVDLVGLPDATHLRPAQLSLGMKQRLSWALAIARTPQALIMDEPDTGLDAHGLADVSAFLRGFAHDGGTAIVSSHRLDLIDRIADTILYLVGGRLRAAKEPEPDRPAAHAATIVRSTETGSLRTVLEAAGANIDARGDGALRVVGWTPESVASAAVAHAGILIEIRTEYTTTEMAYFEAERESL